MALRLALAGDAMLGRGVANAIAAGDRPLVDSEVVAIAAGCDLFLLNLECCISDRGGPWAGRRFHFRAPPAAAELLASWSVDCVTLANNHALDYGPDALVDTLEHLGRAGVAWAGAGADLHEARATRWLTAAGQRVAVVAATDHPADYAATEARAGVAYADLGRGVPGWLTRALADAAAADVILCGIHWGPNMTHEPVPHVRSAARSLLAAGATLVAGHSAHVPHGAGPRVLYDLGDFLDDYAVDGALRNDLGLLFLVTIAGDGTIEAEAVPLALDFCHTRLADTADAALVIERFLRACGRLGTPAESVGSRARVLIT
jgi:poly-gamma-glutamate capsule biosynthesis protein CapA/YwtB (metallophosphatase superfamily)